ncbi:uncharacterized protein LOC126674592 isoform X1 [Mercurialis annua]|uniref:uncharacterized protein LOC126674592 isoform X1 n=1 Tax=Mercurialis annua TaxID=3986 RepID=UPI00215F6511|nr:uncharacterized protein LOC126674592 isoform X1 [Mercurialis annua]
MNNTPNNNINNHNNHHHIRKGDARIYIVTAIFFSCIISGGVFLALYIFLPLHKSQPWFPTAGLILVAIPWFFWFLLYLYRCCSPKHTPCPPCKSIPGSEETEASAIAPTNTYVVDDDESHLRSLTTPTPPLQQQQQPPDDGERHVHFGGVVVITEYDDNENNNNVHINDNYDDDDDDDDVTSFNSSIDQDGHLGVGRRLEAELGVCAEKQRDGRRESELPLNFSGSRSGSGSGL